MAPLLRWKRVGCCAAFVLAGCGDSSGPDLPRAAEIVVAPSAVTIVQLGAQELSVSVVDDEGRLLSGVPVTFASTDEAIVTVSALGMVTSVGPAGTAAIVVEAADLERQVPVTVTPVANRIVVAPDPGVVPQKGTLQLDVQLLDLDGTPVPGASFEFESGNTAILTVSQTGLVTSVGPAGQTGIAISSGNLNAQVIVAVTQVPTALVVRPNPIRIGRGLSLQVGATVEDAVGAPIAGSPFTFAAAPSTLFSMTATGLLTASQTLGDGTVTVRSGQLEAVVPASVVAVTHPAGVLASTTPAQIGPYGPAVAGDGRIAVGGLNNALALGMLPGFGLTTTPLSGLITAVAFSPSGRLFASGAPFDGVSEVNPATGAVLGSVAGLVGTPFDLVVSPDEQTLYLSTGDGWVYFIDIPSRSVRDEVQVAGALVHLALHPSLPLLYASPQGSPQIFEIHTETLATRPIAVQAGAPQAIEVSPDGNELYLANEAGSVEVITLASGATAASIPLDCGAYGLGVTPDGAQLYVSCSLAGAVRILDVASRTVLDGIPVGGLPRRIAVSPEGATVVVANEGGWVDFIQ